MCTWDTVNDCSSCRVQLKIWQEKAQILAEESTKHKAALETELRTLRAAQEEMAVKFDESLTTLQMASILYLAKYDKSVAHCHHELTQ